MPGPVLLSGATGLIGGRLLAGLARDAVGVRALTRSPGRPGTALAAAEIVGWDGRSFPEAAVRGCSAVVHLAGEPVFAGRLTARRRREILASRVESTRSAVEAIAALPVSERPGVLACASAVGLYGSRGEQRLDEDAEPGAGFLAEVCRAWEDAARGAEAHGVRVVLLRFGIVLSRDGGALPVMARPFRLGLGGRLGDGRQWVPWVHLEDAAALLRSALEDERYAGPVNVVSPGVVRNLELTRALARALRRPAMLPVPAFALRAALGELSVELLGSRRVVPSAALARGFAFAHPDLDSALEAELGGSGSRRPSGAP